MSYDPNFDRAQNTWRDSAFNDRLDPESVGDSEVQYSYMREGSLSKFDRNFLDSTTIFKAIVLRVERGQIGRSYLAQQVGDSMRDYTPPSNTYVRIRARIPELHCHIPTPERVGGDDDPRGVIEMHPLFVSRGLGASSTVKAGDIVYVSFNKGPNGGIQSDGIYHGVFEEGVGGVGAASTAAGSAAAAFEPNSGTNTRPLAETRVETPAVAAASVAPEDQPSATPSETINDARCYDQSDIPNKSQHRPYLSGLHPDFLPYVKIFICRCWDRGIKIQINSGYRDQSDQQRVYDQWVANGRTGPRPTQGLSYHNFGMAFDFNPTLSDGRVLTSDDTKTDWDEIKQIGEAAGLYWGGNFRGNYDPIHFDFRNTLSRNDRQAFLEGALASGTSPNRYPIQT